MPWRHLFVVQIELSVDGIYLSEETFNGYVMTRCTMCSKDGPALAI
jgi:hypothetical protein